MKAIGNKNECIPRLLGTPIHSEEFLAFLLAQLFPLVGAGPSSALVMALVDAIGVKYTAVIVKNFANSTQFCLKISNRTTPGQRKRDREEVLAP